MIIAVNVYNAGLTKKKNKKKPSDMFFFSKFVILKIYVIYKFKPLISDTGLHCKNLFQKCYSEINL